MVTCHGLVRIYHGMSTSLLPNTGFVTKAPAQVVARERDKLAELQTAQAKLAERLAQLSASSSTEILKRDP